MNPKAALIGAVVLAALGASASANATTIDFSNEAIPGTYNPVSTFVSSGFYFQSNSAFAVVDSASEGDPNLQHPAPGDMFATWLTPGGGGSFSKNGGGTFELNSIDVNWWDFYYPFENHDWSITGTFQGGGTATVNGVLAPGAFVAENLNWANLVSVSFTGYSPDEGWMGVDNIVVNAGVPEPSTWAMLLMGVFGLGAALRLRRSARPATVAA